MSNAYIVAVARTPIGRFGGTLKDTSPVELGAHAIKSVLARAGVSGGDLDLYIMGNVLRAGHGQLVPRQSALKAGIPAHVDGFAVDMVCSSGMMSVMQAATLIKAGEADLLLAGGMESMSQAGFYLSSRARWGYKYLAGRPEQLADVLERDGLSDPINGEAMGTETERLAAEFGITRAEVDQVAYQSQKRAAEATAGGKFSAEIAPMQIKTRKGTTTFAQDEGIRATTTPESLGKLRTAFTKDGILTAGNSSQISDGAAALLIASETAIEKYGLTPIAKILRGTWSAGESWRFAAEPVFTLQKLAKLVGFSLSDVAAFENNEAFAVNSVLFNRELGIDYDKLNVFGGAIAMGHPIGCTGARLLVTLTSVLKANGGSLGVASLCHGTGGGTAVAIEML